MIQAEAIARATEALGRAAIEELTESARRHKAAANHHRRAMKADMEAVDRLRADLARLGIKLVEVPPRG